MPPHDPGPHRIVGRRIVIHRPDAGEISEREARSWRAVACLATILASMAYCAMFARPPFACFIAMGLTVAVIYGVPTWADYQDRREGR